MNKDYERIKIWRLKNPKKFKETQKRYLYSKKGKETRKRCQKRYREKNKEKIKKQHHEWWLKNRESLGYTGENASRGTGWDTMRLRVLARDNCICRICNKEGKEIHHLDGTGSNRKRKEMNNDLDNLLTVCHKCHIKLDLIKQGNFSKGKWQEEIERNNRIIELLPRFSQTQIAKIMGITRQRVSQIVKRCKGLDKMTRICYH